MKRYKLANKISAGLLILAVVLIIVTGIFVSLYYRNIRLGQYRNLAYSYSRTLACMIDGDKVKQYYITEETDEYYDTIQRYIDAFARESEDITYAFVFVPDGSYHYIWDATVNGNRWDLGESEEYLDNIGEILSKTFRHNPEEPYNVSETALYGNLFIALSPIFDSEDNPVALAGVDIAVDDIEKDQQGFVQGLILAIALIIIMAYIVFYAIIKRRIVKPVLKLESAARSFVKDIEGSETLNLGIDTRDEIEELSHSFETMSSEVKDYISRLSKVTAEKERIGAELDVAAHIQSSMLPGRFPPFPDRPEFEIYATMVPAKEVGGDFYDFFMIDDRHLAIVAADVSGKGIPAALFMVIGKTLIKDHTTPGTDLGEVFTTVNNLLCDANKDGMFITAFEGVLDLDTGELRFVNAGHEIPFICRKGNKFKSYPIKAGFVLAGMEDMKYKSGTVMLEPGDKFFEYTDGVTEATDSSSNLFGMERLEESLGKYSDMTVDEILPLVKKDIDEFVGEEPQFDDITMICLEYKGRK
ncbi:MAG: SpoIIE family protein phosphatase [Lachnospiraceae bacterium]|nr:SpoIIE family protein phosphatase [Candidatus Darwinimomas equi]